MKHLGSSRGVGILFDRVGAELGEVAFTLDAFEQGGVKEGNGVLTGATKTLSDAFHSGAARIKSENGQEFRLVIDNLGDGAASFKVSGPIPGF